MNFIALKITGKVQRVWFRQSTLKKAEELDIKGIVMNMPDGTVYIEAESDNDSNYNVFLSWCNEGPDDAIVEKVEKIPSVKKGYKKFQVVY